MRIPRLATLFLALLLVSHSATAQEDDAAVVDASKAWLALVDDGQYQQSWESSGSLMRAAVTADQWQQALENVQMQLAALVGETVDLTQRELVEVAAVEDQPNMPEGDFRALQYRVIQGDHVFAEVVTMQLEDGEWKAVGYFVAPENQ